MPRYGGLVLAFAALALAACGIATRGGAVLGGVPEPCGAAGADTAGWRRVDAGPFSFAAPREYRRQRVRGIDSYLGRWSASRRREVSFDWGMYSSPLDETATQLQDSRECTAEIGGRRARVVSGYDSAGTWHGPGRTYVVAAAWRDVRPGMHLTLSATAPDSADVPALLSIVRSIRFDAQPAPGR